MDDDILLKLVEDISGLPSIVKVKGGIVPLPPGQPRTRMGMVIHCLYDTHSGSFAATDVLAYGRAQLQKMMPIVLRWAPAIGIGIWGVTMRFRDRGENQIVYACDLRIDLSQGAVLCVEKEWSHDEYVSAVIGG